MPLTPKDFNYENIDNLKIDSDDEISVWRQGQNEDSQVGALNLVKTDDELSASSSLDVHMNGDLFAVDNQRSYDSLDKCIDDSTKPELMSISSLIWGHRKTANVGRRSTLSRSCI